MNVLLFLLDSPDSEAVLQALKAVGQVLDLGGSTAIHHFYDLDGMRPIITCLEMLCWPPVMREALGVIEVVLCNPESKDAAIEQIRRLNGAPHIIHALTLLDVEVRCRAVTCLEYLAEKPKMRTVMYKYGVLRPVLALMNSEVPKLKDTALLCIMSLSADDTIYADALNSPEFAEFNRDLVALGEDTFKLSKAASMFVADMLDSPERLPGKFWLKGSLGYSDKVAIPFPNEAGASGFYSLSLSLYVCPQLTLLLLLYTLLDKVASGFYSCDTHFRFEALGELKKVSLPHWENPSISTCVGDYDTPPQPAVFPPCKAGVNREVLSFDIDKVHSLSLSTSLPLYLSLYLSTSLPLCLPSTT
jgi:hypothetical protein